VSDTVGGYAAPGHQAGRGLKLLMMILKMRSHLQRPATKPGED